MSEERESVFIGGRDVRISRGFRIAAMRLYLLEITISLRDVAAISWCERYLKRSHSSLRIPWF